MTIENSLDVLNIILSALSAIFTLATFLLALLVYLGWRSAKDFEKKKKEIMINYKQMISKITSEAQKEIKQKSKNVDILIGEIEKARDKAKTPKDFQEYERKTEELVCKLKEVVKEAEDKVSNLRISSTASVLPTADLFPTGSAYISGLNIPSSLSYRTCKKCGNVYPETPLEFGGNKCPICGNID